MKRMMSVLMLILGVFTASAARAEEKSVEQTLTGIEQEIADKMVKGDVSAMEAYAADTLSFTDPGGALMDRAALLAEFKSDKLKFEMVKLDEVKVQVYGTTAVVTYRSTDKGTYEGQDISGQYRWTDVFVQQDGKWKMVASHGTPIMPEEK